jgi:hypothetical protein
MVEPIRLRRMTYLGRMMSQDDVENEEKNNGLKKFKFKKYPKCISYYLVPKTPPNLTPSKLHSIFHVVKTIQVTLNQPS